MASLADLLDPDQWIMSGKNLLDFPWPEGNNEREAVKLILSTRPLLNAHYERWSKRVMEALGRRGGEKSAAFLRRNICVSSGSEPALRHE
jgi:hypothetical protein